MDKNNAIDKVWNLVIEKRINEAKETAYKNGIYFSECEFTGEDEKQYIKYHIEDDAIVYSADETFVI